MDRDLRFEVRCRDIRGGEHVVGWTRDAGGASLVKLAQDDPEICAITVIDTNCAGSPV